MRERLRSHLTYANVISTLCLFLLLGGGSAVALSGTNTVQSDDLGPGAQVKAPDVAAGAVNGSSVVNGSLTGVDIAPSALPTGRKVESNCDPVQGGGFADCGHLTINLPRPGLRVLIAATAEWSKATAAGIGTGSCRLGVNGAQYGPNVRTGTGSTDPDYGSVTLTNITDPNLGAGNHTIGLACEEFAGAIKYNPTMISAVVLGPG